MSSSPTISTARLAFSARPPDPPEDAVDDGRDAEIGRARRPGRADRGGSERGDDRLGHIGRNRGHPVAGPDAVGDQGRGRLRDGGSKRAARHRPARAVFDVRQDGRRVIVSAQQVLGEVEARVWKGGISPEVSATDIQFIGQRSDGEGGERRAMTAGASATSSAGLSGGSGGRAEKASRAVEIVGEDDIPF